MSDANGLWADEHDYDINPHNDAHIWGVWKDNGEYGEVRYCLDCAATDDHSDLNA